MKVTLQRHRSLGRGLVLVLIYVIGLKKLRALAATFGAVTLLLARAKLLLGRLDPGAGSSAKLLLPGTTAWFVARDTAHGDGPRGAFSSGSGFLSHKLDASFQDMTECNVSCLMSNSSRTKSRHCLSCAG